MRRDWIAGLHAEWDRVNAASKVCQAGAWLPNGPDDKGTGHINGNCLVTGDLDTVKWMMNLVGGVCINAGWDWLLAPQFKNRGWSDIPGIRSVWRQRISEKDFLAGMKEKQIWRHGVKDSVGLQLCRKHLL